MGGGEAGFCTLTFTVRERNSLPSKRRPEKDNLRSYRRISPVVKTFAELLSTRLFAIAQKGCIDGPWRNYGFGLFFSPATALCSQDHGWWSFMAILLNGAPSTPGRSWASFVSGRLLGSCAPALAGFAYVVLAFRPLLA